MKLSFELKHFLPRSLSNDPESAATELRLSVASVWIIGHAEFQMLPVGPNFLIKVSGPSCRGWYRAWSRAAERRRCTKSAFIRGSLCRTRRSPYGGLWLIGMSERQCARLSRRSDQSASICGEARVKKPGAVSRPGFVGVARVRRACAAIHRLSSFAR